MMAAGQAAELPSFLQRGDVFCAGEADYDDFVAHGRTRAGSATETCHTIDRATRVAVIGGRAAVKSMVRVMNGPSAFVVGWTNGPLPLARRD